MATLIPAVHIFTEKIRIAKEKIKILTASTFVVSKLLTRSRVLLNWEIMFFTFTLHQLAGLRLPLLGRGNKVN